MGRIFERFMVGKTEFSCYDDFKENFKLKVPEDFNYAFDVVDVLAREQPDKLALVWCNDKGEKRNFTFSQMAQYVNKTANYFKSLGIQKGDKAMLILKRHYEFWFSILALHKIGAVVVPATNLLTKKDVVYRNNSADIKMIVCTAEGDVAEHVAAAAPESVTLELMVMVGGQREGFLDFGRGMEAQSDVFQRPVGDEATHNEDMMLLYFTSGTTGLPKMVCHDYLYPLGHLATGVYWHNAKADGLHLTVADTGWGKAVWGKLYGQWMAETAIMVYDYNKFDPAELLSVIEKFGVTSFCAPPTIYRFFIKEDLTKYDLKWNYCTIAGEPLNPEVYYQFLENTGIRLMEGFGQTETTLSLATYCMMDPRPGSMGKPSPGYEIQLLNDEGRLCEDGEYGEIVICTDCGKPMGMFMGNYNDEEMTKSVWCDGIYHTGDIAWRDEDGYYWYVGRSDDVIKSSGYRIGPFEVESALIEHPAVLETAITGVPHPERGQVVKATVVLAKGYRPSDDLAKELQEHVKKVTAPYKYPRIIDFVEELPKTISGKIRRVELRGDKK
ncbi:MAG: AMP-binding protein [Christensenellales bacterium]|jgi:acetyl-CoA synthetase